MQGFFLVLLFLYFDSINDQINYYRKCIKSIPGYDDSLEMIREVAFDFSKNKYF